LQLISSGHILVCRVSLRQTRMTDKCFITPYIKTRWSHFPCLGFLKNLSQNNEWNCLFLISHHINKRFNASTYVYIRLNLCTYLINSINKVNSNRTLIPRKWHTKLVPVRKQTLNYSYPWLNSNSKKRNMWHSLWLLLCNARCVA
jgi:hypothetical protein